jgi:hypothetical protein
MDQSLKKRISERAYEIWAAHGRADGQADQHWLAAEREVLAASTAALARKSAPQKKKSAAPAKEAAGTGTCEDRQHPRRGELTPRSETP